MSNSINIAIADDHLIVVNGLRAMLATRPGFQILFQAQDGDSLWEQLQTRQPDVLLLDIQMPGLSGPELCRKIHKQFPDIRIVVLTSHDTPAYVKQMIRSGAAGYLVKNSGMDALFTAIGKVMEGEKYIDDYIRNGLVQEALAEHPVSRYEIPLTRREKDILQLIAEELSNPEIAARLCISLRTVETHRQNIIHKLRVKNTVGLVKEAIRRGLI
ncbi:response regulator [Chitinophaga sp. NPDC101104]|uniref:response regulator n=1 Tax=Chitinophaga sp. NPDC101104 TaxID=3390561 RepID=UPI003D01FCE4